MGFSVDAFIRLSRWIDYLLSFVFIVVAIYYIANKDVFLFFVFFSTGLVSYLLAKLNINQKIVRWIFLKRKKG